MKQEETLLAKMSQIQIKKTLARENAEKNLQAILKKKKELIFSTRNFKEVNNLIYINSGKKSFFGIEHNFLIFNKKTKVI